jgi:hypothetical protein
MIRQAAARSNKQICEAVRYCATPRGRASWLYRNVVRLPFDSGCAYQCWADVGHISAPEASRSRTGVDGLKVSWRRCSDVPSSPPAWANPSAQAGLAAISASRPSTTDPSPPINRIGTGLLVCDVCGSAVSQLQGTEMIRTPENVLKCRIRFSPTHLAAALSAGSPQQLRLLPPRSSPTERLALRLIAGG